MNSNDKDRKPLEMQNAPPPDVPAWFEGFSGIFAVLITVFTGVVLHPLFWVISAGIFLIALIQKSRSTRR